MLWIVILEKCLTKRICGTLRICFLCIFSVLTCISCIFFLVYFFHFRSTLCLYFSILLYLFVILSYIIFLSVTAGLIIRYVEGIPVSESLSGNSEYTNPPLKDKEDSGTPITESEDHPRETIDNVMPVMITQPYSSSYAAYVTILLYRF